MLRGAKSGYKETRVDRRRCKLLKKDHGETTEMVWTCGDKRRTHSEESTGDGYTMKIEDTTTENKIGDHSTCQNVA